MNTQHNNLRSFWSISHQYSHLFYQGFLQTVSNLFDVNNLRDFIQLQKVELQTSVNLSVLVSADDCNLEFVVNFNSLN